MKKQHAILYNRLDVFLQERGKSDSGWAEVKEGEDGDIRKLSEIIYGIIEAKYERDCDGDLPIEYMLVNRHKGRFAIPDVLNNPPYLSRKNYLEVIRNSMSIVRIAADDMRIAEVYVREAIEDKKDATK